jgi:hypothetical protein
MVVGRSQNRAVRWMRQDSPLKLYDGLSGMQTCVWPRIVVAKKHFCHIFMGTNPPETLLQSPHRRPSWSFGLWAIRLWESPLHSPKKLSPWSCWLRELT